MLIINRSKLSVYVNLVASLLLGIIIFNSKPAGATIFSVKQKGNYDQQGIWSPYYPGNVIKEADTVIINNIVGHNIDLVVKGTLIIKDDASFAGRNHIIIAKSGTMLNLGTCKFISLTNRGVIYNQNIVEVSMDFVNSGNVVNHNKIDVNNLLDNTGTIVGTEGTVSANRKFVNSRTGILKGYLDVCSNNFMNVEGGSIETATITFCGNPIMNENSLLSKQGESDPLHFEKSVSVESILRNIEPPTF